MSNHYLSTAHKAQLLIFLGILYLIGCKPEESTPKEVVENYGTGQVSRRFTVINNKKEGPMTDYYPSGKLKGERIFKNDVQIDKTIIYYESGSKKEVQYFKDGKINGGDSTFYESGKPQMVINFTNGIKDGYVRSFGEDGTMTYEAKFSMDTIIEVKGQPIRRDSSNHQAVQSKDMIKF
ncbi:MAG: hypothetical protein ABIQ02_06815 [Saprospiraceae bacterium]